MRVLITGLNRSGTSAMANLLALGTGLSLRDDPEAVITPTVGSWEDRRISQLMSELSDYEIVKAPRMTELVERLVEISPDLVVVHMVRDPRDVYASILEKVRACRPTRMLDNARFDADGLPPEVGLAKAAKWYHDVQLRLLGLRSDIIVEYSHFASDPELVLRAVAIHIGEQWLGVSEGDQHRRWGPAANNVHAEVSGVGRWQQDLARRDADEIWSIAGDAYRSVSLRCSCPSCDPAATMSTDRAARW